MSGKVAVVLAGGVPQIELLHKLKARGFETVLVDYTEHPVAEKHADRFYRESTLDVEAVRKIVLTESACLLVTCCTDQAMLTVSQLSEELGLPCYIDAATGLKVTNKAHMKHVFQEKRIPSARYIPVGGSSALSLDGYPMVVKPVDCNSSKGVRRVNSQAELDRAVSDALRMSRSGKAVVEEYLEGDELSVDCFIENGEATVLCISRSDKLSGGDGFVICRGIYYPHILRSYFAEAGRIAQRIADAFNLTCGPMLIQLIAGKEGLKVIEFSARTGGCVKYKMIELASGIDVIEATIDVTLGIMPAIRPTFSRKIISDEFVYVRKGIFDRIRGMDECVNEGLAESYHILHSPGKLIDGISSSGDRVLAFTIVAGSEEEYARKFDEISSRIDVLDSSGDSMIRRDLLVRKIG